MFNVIWFDALVAALKALFKKSPAEEPKPRHDWKFEGDNIYRYRTIDGQIRGKVVPVEGGNWRVETIHGFKAVYIDQNRAFDALEEAFP